MIINLIYLFFINTQSNIQNLLGIYKNILKITK